ncbi:helix-turn-helix domain-containing protein [Streptomyces sp. NPDC051639]|uniref:helix-turn-helix domain-containing protein n=1 Tax=Streptomyces sp. NPDC051639 TaxID=3155671 RepID=UPI003447CE2E
MSSNDRAQPLSAQAFAEAVIEMAHRFERSQTVLREDAKTTEGRMMAAGMARRAWKRVEDTLPELIAEAHRDPGWTAEHIAGVLGVSESYVYRILRKRSAEPLPPGSATVRALEALNETASPDKQ